MEKVNTQKLSDNVVETKVVEATEEQLQKRASSDDRNYQVDDPYFRVASRVLTAN